MSIKERKASRFDQGTPEFGERQSSLGTKDRVSVSFARHPDEA